MTDFHSHILPGIDDGSKDVQMSEQMLKLEAESGITTIVATPHFYLSEQGVEKFAAKREAAFEKLKPVAERMGIEIVKGAEVLYKAFG